MNFVKEFTASFPHPYPDLHPHTLKTNKRKTKKKETCYRLSVRALAALFRRAKRFQSWDPRGRDTFLAVLFRGWADRRWVEVNQAVHRTKEPEISIGKTII